MTSISCISVASLVFDLCLGLGRQENTDERPGGERNGVLLPCSLPAGISHLHEFHLSMITARARRLLFWDSRFWSSAGPRLLVPTRIRTSQLASF